MTLAELLVKLHDKDESQQLEQVNYIIFNPETTGVIAMQVDNNLPSSKKTIGGLINLLRML